MMLNFLDFNLAEMKVAFFPENINYINGLFPRKILRKNKSFHNVACFKMHKNYFTNQINLLLRARIKFP